jgi:hypothetical protein
MRPLIYIASPLSEMPLDYLHWLGKMNDKAFELWEQGWAPYIPGNDLLFCYRSPKPFTPDELYEIDASYVAASDAVYIIAMYHNDGRESVGVKMEHDLALQLDIPIVYTMEGAEQLLKELTWMK